MGIGPKMASLDVTQLSREQKKDFCRELFYLEARPEEFLPGEPLFQLVKAALAHLLMYAEERWKANEFPIILQRLCDVYLAVVQPRVSRGVSGMTLARRCVFKLGDVIRAEWTAVNLHLTSREKADGSTQVVHAIQTLEKVVLTTHKEVQSQASRLLALEISNQKLMGMIEGMAEQQTELIDALARARSAAPAAAAAEAAPGPALPLQQPARRRAPPPSPVVRAQVEAAVAGTADLNALLAPRHMPKLVTMARLTLASLAAQSMGDHHGDPPPMTIGDKSRANIALKFFRGVSAREEDSKLFDAINNSLSDRLAIASAVVLRLQGRFVAAYNDNGEKVPKSLKGTSKNFRANLVDTQVRALAKMGIIILADADADDDAAPAAPAAPAAAASATVEASAEARSSSSSSSSGNSQKGRKRRKLMQRGGLGGAVDRMVGAREQSDGSDGSDEDEDEWEVV